MRFRQIRGPLQHALGELSDIHLHFRRRGDAPGRVLLRHIVGRQHGDDDQFELIGCRHPYSQLQCPFGPWCSPGRDQDTGERSRQVLRLPCATLSLLSATDVAPAPAPTPRERLPSAGHGKRNNRLVFVVTISPTSSDVTPLIMAIASTIRAEERGFGRTSLKFTVVRPRSIGFDHQIIQGDCVDELLVALTITGLGGHRDVIPCFNNRPGDLG